MSTSSWASSSNGDWNTPSNWTSGVPRRSGTAQITVAGGLYTVTSSQDNWVEVLEMSQEPTLSITHRFSVTKGTGGGGGAFAGTIEVTDGALVLGTYDPKQTQKDGTTDYTNTGTIAIQRSGALLVRDAVVLNGGGKIVFSNNGKIEVDVDGNRGGYLGQITSDNTISGVGVIGEGADHPYLIFINAPNGVIDANGDTLLIDVGTAFINNGLMQASTDLGILSIIGAITNNGTIAAVTAGATIQLANGQINGGTVEIAAGATLLAQLGKNEINTTTPIANNGTISTDGGTLAIVGSVNNTVSSENNFESLTVTDYMRITGDVTGGGATLYEKGELSLGGAASMDVLFDSSATGALVLGIPEQFTGTIAGMDMNPIVRIDLINLPYSPNISLTVAGGSVSSVVSVYNPISQQTFSLNIAGHAFITKKAKNGSTLIFCTGV